MAATIEILSAERVRDELVKLLMAPHPRAGLELLCASGLADHVIPELPALQLEVDEHHRHKDVYEHSMTVLEQAIDLEGPAGGPPESVPGPDLVLRLASLLHDVGKPATRRFEEADDRGAGQRFAGARFTDHAEDLAGRDVEGDVVQRAQGAAAVREFDNQVSDLKKAHISAASG